MRIWQYVRVTGFCWEWTGRTWKGYGQFAHGPAHRAVYERLIGPIPAGLELDHLCRRPLCVNPDHLEPVTRAENMRRRYSTYVACSHGHEFTAANTYIRSDGTRDCRDCVRARKAASRARQRTGAAA